MNWTDRIAPNIITYSIWVIVTSVLWFALPQTIALSTENETAGSVFGQILASIDMGGNMKEIGNLVGAFLISYLIFYINEKFSLIRMRTMLPTIVAAFFLTLFTTHNMASSGGIHALLALLAVIMALIYAGDRSEKHTFNIGMVIALGAVNFPLFLLYVIPIISFFRFCNIFTARTLLSLSMGFIVALIYAVPFLYFVLDVEFSAAMVPRLELIDLDGYSELNITEKIFSVVVLVLSIFSLCRLSIFFTHESVRQRGMFTLLFAFFLISVCFAVIFQNGIGYALHTIIAFGSLFFGCVVSTLYDKELIVKWMSIGLAVINFVFVVMQYFD